MKLASTVSNRAARARRHRRGSALILAIGAAIPLLIAGGALLCAVTKEQDATEQSVVISQARDAAASGAHSAIAELSTDPNLTGTLDVTVGGALARVTVTPWKGDKVDNDQNGVVDDAGEDLFIGINSVGTANVRFDANGNELAMETQKGRSTVNVIVKKNELKFLTEQAVYVDDPLATFKFAGTSFLVSGNDTNINNTAGPKSAIAGLGTPGLPTAIKNQLSSKQKPLVVGKGGAPSVLTVADIDLAKQMAALTPMATLVWSDPDNSYGGDIGDRAKLQPIVAHAKGNLKLNGNTKGCGILIVDGDLTVNGSFDFVGLIFCSGGVTFNGGGGNKDLHGALYALGAVNGPDVTLNGTVQLRYSSEAISVVTSKLAGGVSLISWTQR